MSVTQRFRNAVAAVKRDRDGVGLFSTPRDDPEAFATPGSRSHRMLLERIGGGIAAGLALQFTTIAATAPGPIEQRAVPAALASVALAASLILLRGRRALPTPLLDSMLIGATFAICLAGTEYQAVRLAAPFTLLAVNLLAFGVRPPAVTVLHLTSASAGYGLLLAWGPPQPAPFARWAALLVAMLTCGLLVQWLVQKVRTIIGAELQAQREAERVSAALQQVNEVKSVFLARMSHELRTPLNAVLGFAGLLRSGLAGPLGPRQAAYVEDIDDAGHHLLALVDDVLDLTRVEQGEVHLEIEEFDLRDVVDEALRLVRHRADVGDVRLNLEVLRAGTRLEADRRLVRQVVVNLLTNAVRFTNPGGRVTVQLGGSHGRVRVSVRDTGIGIAAGDLQRIFAEYQQATDRRDGTGLGLPLARRFVEAHGGRLKATSEAGRGSVFTFELPRQSTSRRPSPRPSAPSTEEATFDAFTAPGSAANRALVARMGTWYSVCGGIFGPPIVLLAPLPGTTKGVAIVVCLAALASAPFQQRFSDAAPGWSLEAMGLGGIAIISVLAAASSELGDIVPLLYVWIVATSFAIWSTRRGLEQLVLIGAAYGLVLYARPHDPFAVAQWVAVMSSLCIVGAVTHWVATTLRRTVAAERAARLRTEAAGVRLAEASRHKTAFLASMSHELRAPLNAIIGFSDVLAQLDVAALTEQQRDYAIEIGEAGRHLLALINDILDLAKLEAGQLVLEPGPVSLPAVVQGAVAAAAQETQRPDVVVEMPDDVPVVVADPVRIQQLVTNLVASALHLSPTGGDVVVAATVTDGTLRLSVEDRSAVVHSSDQERVFEAFHRGADAATDGAGVSLALARGLVELHGGGVEVRSDASGTRFDVRIPVEVTEVAPA